MVIWLCSFLASTFFAKIEEMLVVRLLAQISLGSLLLEWASLTNSALSSQNHSLPFSFVAISVYNLSTSSVMLFGLNFFPLDLDCETLTGLCVVDLILLYYVFINTLFNIHYFLFSFPPNKNEWWISATLPPLIVSYIGNKKMNIMKNFVITR
jgi:hypothetical protein